MKITSLIWSIFGGWNNLRLATFFGSNALIMKSSSCFLNRLRNKNDGWNNFFSGFLSGLAFII
jgi:hypothetical protein